MSMRLPENTTPVFRQLSSEILQHRRQNFKESVDILFCVV